MNHGKKCDGQMVYSFMTISGHEIKMNQARKHLKISRWKEGVNHSAQTYIAKQTNI